MLKFSRKSLIMAAGFLWLAIGFFLTTLGLKFVFQAGMDLEHQSSSLLKGIAMWSSNIKVAMLLLIFAALIVGLIKGHFVLSKSAKRVITRIQQLPEPASIFSIYNFKYYLVIVIMIGLGIAMKKSGLPLDIRGGIDVAVGSALTAGSMLYFRAAKQQNMTKATFKE